MMIRICRPAGGGGGLRQTANVWYTLKKSLPDFDNFHQQVRTRTIRRNWMEYYSVDEIVNEIRICIGYI